MRLPILTAAAFGAAAIFLASCQTMSPEACKVADWRAIGFQDGAEGAALEKFSRRQDDCAKVGVMGDFDDYRRGRDEGLLQYCREPNGFQVGLRGVAYAGVCPPALDAAFRAAHMAGSRVHDAMSAARSAEVAIESLRAERRELETKIVTEEANLVAASLESDRLRARNELVRLRERRNQVDGDIRVKESEAAMRAQELSRLRSDYAARFGPF